MIKEAPEIKSKKEYVVFILSYKRPHRVKTVEMLKRYNYNGDWFIVLSDTDATIKEYKNLFPDKIVVFDFQEAVKITDYMYNKPKQAVVFARNAVFDIAKELGYKYFIVLDDDYYYVLFKFVNGIYQKKPNHIKDINVLFELLIDFLKKTQQVYCIAIAQTGDYRGEEDSSLGRFYSKVKFSRKLMNFFVCDVDRRFEFYGLLNEDVNCYISGEALRKVFITYPGVMLQQRETQKNTGGLTELYLEQGTYVKSFYSVMINPSAVKVSMLGNKRFRFHHKIYWQFAVPEIISSKYQKF